MILERTIKLLCDNGDFDCPDCGHKATDIEALVKVVEAAKAKICMNIHCNSKYPCRLCEAIKALDGKG